MRAMVLPRFGKPDLFELREVETPKPGPGEILVRVVAAGTNPLDAKLRRDGSSANLEPPVILGYDVSGVVEEAGPGVEDLQAGDEVFYTPTIMWNPSGGYAEYNVVRASIVARKPRNLSFVEAAAIPLAGGTAWEAVVRRLAPRPGDSILIHGGAGGVGSFAVQFARACGALVIATASDRNLDFLREIGAHIALDYTKDVARDVLEITEGQGVDAAFDIEGEHRVSRCIPLVRAGGRIACVQGPQGDLREMVDRNLSMLGVFLTRERRRLEEMTPLFERGQARPFVDEVLALEDVAKAHERLDSGHGRGKIVLQVAGPIGAVQETGEAAEEESEKTA